MRKIEGVRIVWIRLCLVSLLLIILCSCTYSISIDNFEEGTSAPILWNMTNLEKVRAGQEYSSIKDYYRQRADKVLQKEFPTVVAEGKKYVNDPHYFYSIGRYMWPDSTNINGPYISRDGHTNPEYNETDYFKLVALTNNLKDLSVAFYFTHDEKYYDALTQSLKVWFMDKDTYMYPNFSYAQICPGRNKNKGNPFGLIEAYIMIDILEAIRLVDTEKSLETDVMKNVKLWFYKFGDWMQKDNLGKKERQAANNHGVAYDVVLYSIADFVSEENVAKEVADSFRVTRLCKQIESDGSQPKEQVRNNAFDYSIYNLTHIVDFCIILEGKGIHYYEENKSIIDSAFAYLWQYVGNEENFPYKELRDWENVEGKLRNQTWRLKRLKGADLDFVPESEKLKHSDSLTRHNLLL